MKPHERPPYPMRKHGAVFVPVHELNIPSESFRWRGEGNINNHHYAFTRQFCGRLAITQTFRDLDANQERLPKTGHQWLHSNFAPPIIPNLTAIMERLDQALDGGEKLRYGTAHEFRLEQMSPQIWQACQDEYNQIHLVDRVEV